MIKVRFGSEVLKTPTEAQIWIKVNVALGGEATQIDTYNKLGAASNAIDGNRDSIYYRDSCTHTFTPTNPWWRVDLRDTYVITSIHIVNRGDCCEDRLDGAEIRVGNSLRFNGNDNPIVAKISHIASSETFTMSEPVVGRYVNVFLPGSNKYLTLCEVEVYGFKADDLLTRPVVSVSEGFWGPREQGGVWVQMSSDFWVRCSVEPQYPGGSFQVLSPTGILTLPAVNHSARFLFTDASTAHRGNYSCVYLLHIFNHNFSSDVSIQIYPGVSDSQLLLRSLILLLLHLLNIVPYIYYRHQATRGRQRSQRARKRRDSP